jgi:mono/diheme cytochrome c family protein
MRRSRFAAVVLAAAFAVGCGDRPDAPGDGAQPPTPPAAPPTPAVELPAGVTQEMVSQGQQLYAGQAICYTCHGGAGEGSVLGPALQDQDWIHIDGSFESIANIIRTGVPSPQQYPGTMPPMGGTQLSDEQIQAIAAYVYSISRG